MIFANYKPDPKKDATIKMLLLACLDGGEKEGKWRGVE